MSNVPLLYRSTSPVSTVGLSYPSVGTNVVGRDTLEGMIDNRAHQYTTASALANSGQIEPHQELRFSQYLYQQYPFAQQGNYTLFTTTTPYFPFTATSPYFTTNISPSSFNQTGNFSAGQGETWNIPTDTPSPSTPCTQPATHPPPRRTIRNRPGKKIFRCECGHETSRKGDMKRHRESLVHAPKGYVCHCGKSYTRKDSLRRHATKYSHSFVLDSIPY